MFLFHVQFKCALLNKIYWFTILFNYILKQKKMEKIK